MKEKFLIYKPQIKFFLAFTIVFFIVKMLFLYLLPFIISLIFAVMMKPVYDFMKRKLSFKPSFSATVITLFIYSIIIALIVFVFVMIFRQAVNIFEKYSHVISDYIYNFDVFQNLYNMIVNGNAMFSKVSSVAVSVFKVVPIAFTLLLITFVLTIFFLNNLVTIKEAIVEKLDGETKHNANVIIDNTYLFVRRFIRSYLILYFITFIEAAFVFILTKTDYPLVFAFLAAVADLLPILGPGAVYVPVAVICLLKGRYIVAITFVVFWLITALIRQIIEPKIVSDSVKINPLLIFCAIYFSIVSMNIWVLFYFVLLFLAYKIMLESKLIDPVFIFKKIKKQKNKACKR